MKQKKSAMRLSTIIGSACLLLILTVGPAQATPLNLTLSNFPDIISGFIDVIYDATTDNFSASGYALELDDGVGMPESISGGTFDITVMIDDSGVASGGTLTIGGTVLALGFSSGTLLTGTLTDFGYSGTGGDPLEFLFDITGGDASGLYGAAPAGVILSATNFGGSFAVDFDNLIGGVLYTGTGTAISDIAPVPEASSLLLFGSGLVTLVISRRWKKYEGAKT